MDRRRKPKKVKAEGKQPLVRKAPNDPDSKVRELEKRLAEALEQQAATAEILGVISRSPTDVQPVLDKVAESAARLCVAHDVVILRRDSDRLCLVAHHGPIPIGPVGEFLLPLVRETVPGRSVLEGRTFHVANLLTEVDEFPESSENARRMGFRAALCVPLLREGTAIGAIALRRAEATLFTDRQVALLQTFADQAVIAIENVRLFTQLREKNRALTNAHAQVTETLEQQTATGEILRVISGSLTDVQPVLDAVAEAAARLCGANDAIIRRVDGEVLRRWAHYGSIALPASLDDLRLTPGWPIGRAILDRRTVHIRDIADPQAIDEYPDARSAAAEVGFRTMLAVPLLREGVAIGAILIRRMEVRPFTDRQIELLQTFADQAVIAIENVRLFTELQQKNRALTQAHAQVSEALEQQTATSDILKVIASTPTDLSPVFEAICRSVVRLFNAHSGSIRRFDSKLVHLAALTSPSPEADERLRSRYPRPPDRTHAADRPILDGTVVHVPDTENDPSELMHQVARDIGYRRILSVPMLREGQVIGAISVAGGEPGPYSAQQIELLQTFADQAVIAIENGRLFTELEARNRDLTATGEILQVISRSPTDVQPVFDTILASAVRLLNAYSGTLTRVTGNHLDLVALKTIDHEGEATVRAAFPLSLPTQGLHGTAIGDRAPVNITDAQTDMSPLGSEIGRAIARAGGYRSAVAVPLLRHDVAVGTIAVVRREAGGFAEDEIALLQTFAEQAVIAIENVRLFKELEARNRDLTETLEQQTATSDILRAISSSQADVQPVFDTIVQSAVRLCDGVFGGVFRVEADMLYLVADYNFSPDAREVYRHVFPLVLNQDTRRNVSARAAIDGTVINLPDVFEESDMAVSQRLSEALGCRAILSVPMLRDGSPIGVITVARAAIGPFSESQVELLKTFADQAVIAIENVRLFSELQERTAELSQSVDELTALGHVSQALSSTLDIETVLTTIVSRAIELSGAGGGSVYEYNDAAEEFELRATKNFEEELVEASRAMPLHRGEGALGMIAERREPVQVPDITDPLAYQSAVREVLVRNGYRAILAVPLLRDDRLVGALVIGRKSVGEFVPGVMELLRTFANQSALAIQNARLFRELADKSRQLEAASQHKSEFLANMSHELRTPLNAIIGFSEVLRERMFGEVNAKQEEYLQDIHASGQHLLSLINDILDLSKIEAGRMELEVTEFDLPSAIDNALILVRERATRRGIALGRSIDDHVDVIRGDERKVKQVLVNLLSNAIKFTPEGGRIDVRAAMNRGMVEISVADTGVGIAPEDQEAIFEEFRQVGTADKKIEGTGLGLALCRKFVELHGGKIWVTSRLGQGSTFTFTLPAASSLPA